MFISLKNGHMYNTKYIKQISQSCIKVRSTCKSSHDDIIIGITKEEYESIMEQLTYPDKMHLLEAENKQLKLEIMYRPGGPGFYLAQNDFKSNIN
jgi:hypothetical protein